MTSRISNPLEAMPDEHMQSILTREGLTGSSAERKAIEAAFRCGLWIEKERHEPNRTAPAPDGLLEIEPIDDDLLDRTVKWCAETDAMMVEIDPEMVLAIVRRLRDAEKKATQSHKQVPGSAPSSEDSASFSQEWAEGVRRAAAIVGTYAAKERQASLSEMAMILGNVAEHAPMRAAPNASQEEPDSKEPLHRLHDALGAVLRGGATPGRLDAARKRYAEAAQWLSEPSPGTAGDLCTELAKGASKASEEIARLKTIIRSAGLSTDDGRPLGTSSGHAYEGTAWIRVKSYVRDEALPFEEQYAQLEKHHEVETKFLIDELRRVANVNWIPTGPLPSGWDIEEREEGLWCVVGSLCETRGEAKHQFYSLLGDLSRGPWLTNEKGPRRADRCPKHKEQRFLGDRYEFCMDCAIDMNRIICEGTRRPNANPMTALQRLQAMAEQESGPTLEGWQAMRANLAVVAKAFEPPADTRTPEERRQSEIECAMGWSLKP